MNKNILSIFLAILITLLFSGCFSSPKVYTYKGPKNLTVYTQLDEGVKAYLGIYTLDKTCKLHWEGRVELTQPKIALSISKKQRAYFVVDFRHSSSQIKQESMVHVKKGEQYIINATYLDGLYNVEFQSKKAKTHKIQELAMIHHKACRQKK